MTDLNPLNEPNATPEDVATLYSWANLHGAKYRDFSAARRKPAKIRASEPNRHLKKSNAALRTHQRDRSRLDLRLFRRLTPRFPRHSRSRNIGMSRQPNLFLNRMARLFWRGCP